jgi:hypothetical protein
VGGVEKGVRSAEPRLVCEIEYRGWTQDRLLRAAAFNGLRDDRPIDEIVLEALQKRSKPGVSAAPIGIHRRTRRSHLYRLSAERPRWHRGCSILDAALPRASVSIPLDWDELSPPAIPANRADGISIVALVWIGRLHLGERDDIFERRVVRRFAGCEVEASGEPRVSLRQ